VRRESTKGSGLHARFLPGVDSTRINLISRAVPSGAIKATPSDSSGAPVAKRSASEPGVELLESRARARGINAAFGAIPSRFASRRCENPENHPPGGGGRANGKRASSKAGSLSEIISYRPRSGNQAVRPSGVPALPACRSSRSLNDAIRDCARPRN
jgi:hypothetical protein